MHAIRALALGAALAGMTMGAATAAAAQQAVELTGTVVDEQGQPVPAATVTARGPVERSAVTGAEGRFRFEALPAAAYVVAVEALGYRSVDRELELRTGQSVRLEVTRAPVGLDPLEVVGVTRSTVPVAAVPGAITVVKREQIEAQADVAPRLGPILTQLVPGLGAGTESVSNYGQNLRGRTVLVLVDGVPQSTSRNVTRDFVNIDPSMVERVEVLRGATAVYGDGATGGVINVITKRGAGGDMRSTTSIGMESSLSAPGDGLAPRLSHHVTGGADAFDWVGGVSFLETAGFYDAEGDRIPSDPHGQGGVADTRSWDVLGKVGYSAGAQRVQLSANWFSSRQDTDFATAPTVTDGGKSQVVEGLETEYGQGSENLVVNAEYTHADVWGSSVRAQAYHRQYETVFRAGDYRSGSWSGNTIFQSYVDSEKTGGRLEVETGLPVGGATLLWGSDWVDELTSQPVHIFDPAVYDASGGLVFDKIDEAYFVPPIRTRSLGLFAQVAVRPVERLMLRGGERHERAGFEVDGFTALNGVTVEGGTLDFAPTLFNVGAVFETTEALDVFVNFSQGFSLADLGRVIRIPSPDFSLGSQDADAQRVSQAEAGVRASWQTVQASVTVFRNTSELGTALSPDWTVVRAPERVYGFELTLDTRPADAVEVGGTLTWTEGEFETTDAQGDVEWVPLNTFRIQPLKATLYAEHRTTDSWRNRLQLLHSGDRDRAYDAWVDAGGDPDAPGFGVRPVESYTTVDLLSSLDVGPGTLDFGVRNLLNRQYFPVVSQLQPIGPTSYSAAPGAVLSVGYTVSY